MIERVGFNVVLLPLRHQLETEAMILLRKVQDGVYEIPNEFIGAVDTPEMTAQSILAELGIKEYAESTSASMVFGEPFRDPEGHNLAQLYVAQLNAEAKLSEDMADYDQYTWFTITSHDKKVDIYTDDTTIILYRDGRLTGDATLALDHSTIITTIF